MMISDEELRSRLRKNDPGFNFPPVNSSTRKYLLNLLKKKEAIGRKIYPGLETKPVTTYETSSTDDEEETKVKASEMKLAQASKSKNSATKKMKRESKPKEFSSSSSEEDSKVETPENQSVTKKKSPVPSMILSGLGSVVLVVLWLFLVQIPPETLPALTTTGGVLQTFTPPINPSLVLMVTIGLTGLFGLYHLYQWRREASQERREAILQLARDATSLVYQHSIKSGQTSGIPIIHVRDRLIPLAEREAKDGLWNEAVEYISENESRLRQERQILCGEDFQVWRWVCQL